MSPSPKVYIGGKLLDKAAARLSVFDHGVLFGDGVSEEMRAHSGRIFRLAEHVERLYDSAEAIRLAIPLGRADLEQAIRETLAANALEDAYIRVIVTRGAGSLDLDPRKTTDPQFIVITDQVSVFPAELYEYGLKVVTAEIGATGPRASVLAKLEATAAGCLDALVLNPRGEVTGGTVSNLFLVRESVLHTPPAEAGVPDPVDRDAVIDLAKAAGCGVVERPLARYDIYEADECFLAGTAARLIPVVECDGRSIGTARPGPITRMLGRRYEAMLRGED